MELGEKLLQARQEAGLSQRQLCGGEITRNMLSQIEHGTAKPSMSTLTYLAHRLGKPVSYFLEETDQMSPNLRCLDKVWEQLDRGDPAAADAALAEYQAPDALCDRMYALLRCLVTLAQAERALEQGREVYARQLLEQAGQQQVPWLPELTRRRSRLLGRLPGPLPQELLPDLEQDLLLAARIAQQQGDAAGAARYLDACGEQQSPRWNLLRGMAALEQKEYGLAAKCLQQAENTFPEQCIPALETAFRELEDYKMAYHYACKDRRRR